MSQKPNVEFVASAQPIQRTSTRVIDDQGNLIDISLTGPEDLVNDYLESTKLRVELVPPEAPKTADPRYEEKEHPPTYPARALEIKISVAQTKLEKYTLRLDADPDICQGCSHYYIISPASQAWTTCDISVGDADLYLYETDVIGNWNLRTSSLASGTQPDSVSADQQATGNWWLQVYGYRDSTYSLSGLFNAV